MEIRQLRYFIKIADLGSLSHASRVLHIAQPALSTQLAQLEGELGQPLLQRRRSGVTMTDAGLAFYRNARRIIRDIDDLKAQVGRAGNQACGTVAIGLPQSVALQIARILIPQVSGRYPSLQVEYFDELSGNLLPGLRGGRFDMCVMVNDEDASLTEAVPLLDEELFLVGAPDTPMPAAPVPVGLLAALPLALPGPEHGVRQLVEQAVLNAGARLTQPALVANSMTIMLDAIRGGKTLGVMPWAAVQDDVRSGALRLRRLEPALSRRAYLCRLHDADQSPAADALWHLMREVVVSGVADGAWQGVRLAVH